MPSGLATLADFPVTTRGTNLRLDQPKPETVAANDDVEVNLDDGGEQAAPGPVLQIEHDDGTITISLDGTSLVKEPRKDRGWFDNLVEDIDELELGRIADDLLRGIADDLTSRNEWVETRTQGMKLLGTKIELPGLQGTADGAPVEGMSKVRHPLLLEAVLRNWANTRAELLPTDGPVKIRVDDNNETEGEDELADALQKDFNHYLTVTASEYYPDTSRMLLIRAFGGSTFKKVYYCPLRNRPVSEAVDPIDLIVNNNATDLKNAKRITHRLMMKPSTVKRMQIIGAYRDTPLADPMPPQLDSAQREKKAQEGVQPDTGVRPEDRDREIYECYCEANIKGFEHKWKGKESGLEIPWRVTIDVTSRKVLAITRNYDKDTEELPEARQTFVMYGFIPGFGFYHWGLVNILGNTTNAITAAWREMLDSGMYANFPGFLIAKGASRQNTTVFRIPPGGGQQVDTGGQKIRDAVMELPYKQPSEGFANFIQTIADTGSRVGGTADMQVGDGRQDAPVGTTIALIDQATKVMAATHKDAHAAQAEEFQLLAQVFREHPESFWQRNRRPAKEWDEATFLGALENYELVPQADPNTASHTQRAMKVVGLKQLQAGSPNLYNPVAVERAAMRALGWNPDEFLNPSAEQGALPPEAQEKVAELQIKKQVADATTQRANTEAMETQARIGLDTAKLQQESAGEGLATKAKMAEAVGDQTIEREKLADNEAGRKFEEKKQLIDVAQNLAVHPEAAHLVEPLIAPALAEARKDTP